MSESPGVVELVLADGSRARISRYGAQLLSWQTADGREHLYLSPNATLDGSSSIRGGVPLCFPQFNQRVIGDQPQPKHGFARSHTWQLLHQQASADLAQARFGLSDGPETHRTWRHAFAAEVVVSLSPSGMRVAFELQNRGTLALEFALALHTYFAVDDIRHAQLSGLQGVPYWDGVTQLHSPNHRQTAHEALRFGEPTDSVYPNAPRQLSLMQASGRLNITASASLPDVVVWNPGHSMADMPPDDWQRMLCVEAGAIEQPVRLAPGAQWSGWQAFSVV
jgi:glucose-6-phosphate 1-epimerase